jgi:hypothetical protein
MHGIEWTSYEYQPAPTGLLCRFRRKNPEYAMFVGYARDFPSLPSIVGLEWQLTGIAREQLENMSDAAGQQLMPQTFSQAALDAMSAMVQISCAQMTAQVFADCWGGHLAGVV